MAHPYRDVAVVGAFNTRQARVLEGYDSLGIAIEAALGVLAEAGIQARRGATACSASSPPS